MNSDLLRTAALHQRLDAMTSSVVLISMLAYFSGISSADAIGAFIVSLFIFKHAGPLCYKSVMELIDRGASKETFWTNFDGFDDIIQEVNAAFPVSPISKGSKSFGRI